MNHLTKHQIDRYYQRSLSPAEIVSVCRHLETCEVCREEVGGRDRFENAFMAFGAGLERAGDQDRFHLSPELSLAYLKGEIGEIDAEILESHVEECLACAAELQDLRAFESQSGKLKRDSRKPATNPWRIFKGFRLSPISWKVIQAALLLVFVVLVAATITLQNQVRRLSARLAELETVNNDLQQEISSLSGSKDERPQMDGTLEGATSAPAEISVSLNDGGKLVALGRDGDLSGLGALPARYERIVKAMLASGEAQIPSEIAVLAGKRETLMGTPKVEQLFHLLSPVGVVVLENRPTFSWTALDGVTSYSVDLFDSNSNKVEGSGEIDLTRWTPRHDLIEGRTYIWQVTATKDGKEVLSPAPPLPQARFRVLDAASRGELERAKSRYSTSHLLLGGIYAQAGLLEEAEREFKALVSGNADSTIARKLLQSVQSARR